MSTSITHSPANQDRPLLLRPPDQRRIRTLLDLLTIEKMDGVDRTMRREGGNNISRWKILRERLGLNAIGCCGVTTWRYENSSPPEEENGVVILEETGTRRQEEVGPTEGMNLAAALAAERQFRAAESSGSYGVDERSSGGATPLRVSLMRLLEETADGRDLERERSNGGGGGEVEEVVGQGSDTVCCVCMERKKGAALIPCGHTYCRVCSRELWLNRGSCPLCNRRILEILDIF